MIFKHCEVTGFLKAKMLAVKINKIASYDGQMSKQLVITCGSFYRLK